MQITIAGKRLVINPALVASVKCKPLSIIKLNNTPSPNPLIININQSKTDKLRLNLLGSLEFHNKNNMNILAISKSDNEDNNWVNMINKIFR